MTAESQNSSPKTARNTAALVALLVLIVGLALTIPRTLVAPRLPAGADAPAYCRIARVFSRTGSLALPPPWAIDHDFQQDVANPFGTPYAVTVEGRLFPKHSFLFGLFLVPGWVLGSFTGAQLNYLLLPLLLSAWVTYRLARSFGWLAAFASASIIFLAIPGGRNIALGMNVDTAITLCAFSALDLAAQGKTRWAGAVGAIALFLRPTAIVLLVGLPLVAWERGRRRGLVHLLQGAAPGILLQTTLNTLWWGAPWLTPYNRTGIFTAGRLTVVDHASTFGANWAEGAAQLLFAFPNGLVFVFPLLLVAPFGFLRQKARKLEWLSLFVTGGIAFLSLGSYRYAVEHPDFFIYRFAFPLWVASSFPLASLIEWILEQRSRSASASSSAVTEPAP